MAILFMLPLAVMAMYARVLKFKPDVPLYIDVPCSASYNRLDLFDSDIALLGIDAHVNFFITDGYNRELFVADAGTYEYRLQKLDDRLKQIRSCNSRFRFILKADKNLPYSYIRKLIPIIGAHYTRGNWYRFYILVNQI
ncbi:hypothetical protein ACTHGU_21655 [Chitinophagaceae bacterium MMS25-I14]